jgi:hypothetical protein
MWPRWSTLPIVARGLTTLPAEMVPGPRVGGNRPFIRARDAVSAPARGSSAVPDATAAQLPVGRPHSITATGGVARPRGRPPPAHPAPSEALLAQRRRPPRAIRLSCASAAGDLLCGAAQAGAVAAFSLLAAP